MHLHDNPGSRQGAQRASNGTGPTLPPGTYPARFVDCEVKDGRAWWWFEITGGDYKGCKVSQPTGPEPTEKSDCRQFACWLMGRVLRAGDAFTTDTYIGQPYQ